MKKSTLLLTACLFAANPAVSARAADYGQSGMGMDKMKGECLMDGDGMGGDCMLMGRHKMTGTVSMVNYVKGTLALKSSVADMTLNFPTDAIKTFRNGDTITVYLGFRMTEPAAME